MHTTSTSRPEHSFKIHMHIDIASIFCVVYNKYIERISSFAAIRHIYTTTSSTRVFASAHGHDQSTNTKYDKSCVCVAGILFDVWRTVFVHRWRRGIKKSLNIFCLKIYSIALRPRKKKNNDKKKSFSSCMSSSVLLMHMYVFLIDFFFRS